METANPATEFYMPSGIAYTAQLISFEEKEEELVATIEVSPEGWDTIDMLMLFNLTWENRNPGSVSGTKPVQIEMIFSADRHAELRKANNLMKDSISFLKADSGHPIKNTQNWFITQVTEEVDLTEESKSMGSLREGYILFKKMFE